MTIDERLQALAESLEILTHDVHGLQEAIAADRERRLAAEERERTLRIALLRGVTEFLRGLDGEQAGG